MVAVDHGVFLSFCTHCGGFSVIRVLRNVTSRCCLYEYLVRRTKQLVSWTFDVSRIRGPVFYAGVRAHGTVMLACTTTDTSTLVDCTGMSLTKFPPYVES